MTRTPPDLVRELATEVLDSFEKLEVVVAIARASKPLTAEELAVALRIDRVELVEPLASLAREQVIASTPSGYELVERGTWSEHVRQLTALYDADRIAVVTVMSEASLVRLRRQANRAFADAFVIRARKKDGDNG